MGSSCIYPLPRTNAACQSIFPQTSPFSLPRTAFSQPYAYSQGMYVSFWDILTYSLQQSPSVNPIATRQELARSHPKFPTLISASARTSFSIISFQQSLTFSDRGRSINPPKTSNSTYQARSSQQSCSHIVTCQKQTTPIIR